MTDTAIRSELDADGILLLTIDVPGQSMNVITPEVQRDLAAAIVRLKTDDAVKGAVLTSGKPSGFMAGADLKGMGALFGGGVALPAGAGGDPQTAPKSKMAALFDGVFQLNRLLRDLETCGKPVAAAVNGLALGGGLEFVLACHYRVIADNPKITLGLPEVMVGLFPGAGGTQRLPRLMGVQPALMYLLQGKNMSPQEALGFGVVQAVVPADQVVQAAKDWVKANPTKGVQPWDEKNFKFPGGVGAFNPAFAQTFMAGTAMTHVNAGDNMNAPKAILSAVYEGTQLPMDTAIRVESKYFAKVVADPQAGNMIRSLFVSKQAAEKGARRPAGVAAMPTKKIGMLGAGLMGAGVAMVTAQAGIAVVLLDRDLAAAEKGKQYTADRLAKKRTDPAKAQAILDRIHPTADYADLAGCDLIIEAVFETREIKADVTKATEAVVGADTIFGSNTSTLPITGLATAWSKPANFIGIHFFSPVEKMPLVEIIVGKETGPEAIAKALDYVAAIRKTPIVVNDSRGFYTSRCFGTYVQEGLALLGEGTVPALIENVGKQMGMPVGPLAVNDEVGLDLSYKVGQQTKADLGDKYVEQPGVAVIETMHELGRQGRKNGKGFYVYPEGGKKYLWPDLVATVSDGLAPTQPTPEAVRERLLYRQLVECARCFAEGVLETPEDGDLGAIFGWGFAPFTGGPFSHMDTIGLANVVAILDGLAQRHGERFAPPHLLRDMAEKGETFYGRARLKAAA
ncbi:3-hydroxyacyl-CoA dehydrogenase NAD-binding domain-containing protein [Polymorphobacter fuscus]|uniref:3-hydroxyacyl-CoA dehydrogenase n=1 Tax=Sandarakinorhabdus fusca TaxID=1439888 RepID=A0A7C9KJS1_9SPHN|nr:3-hydroxyacyl-CoA dehydrogenase NAD-binding domain-containing protein [Polymorphobacter fuscus]KAB7644362.1 3-hydroxyacyl-CoA dehydrogenase [Polymorphobacter fuscus]MQT18279.1 3-hydroxyacyl-CoA dehydrogenase [Polymorphobacter fuscus]NJC08173.1 3-hydroxyacyl-CoA dehydrogenase/enoyl-CoA hydratase/3-hydroxybutyryl-CoA epimerase [Polymorphobacter fuscus]